MKERFSQRRVARILGVGSGQVQSWCQMGVVSPREIETREGAYSFEDLVELRTARTLMTKGLPARALREGMRVLRGLFPGVSNPLSRCNPRVFARRLMVQWEGRLLEVESGQLLLEHVVEEGGGVGNVIPLNREEESAWEWFKRGLLYDTDVSTYHLAIEAYGQAIAACPQLVEAYVNQGNVWFNLGALAEAERSYRRAIGIHPHYAPAYFNLGNLLEDEGRYDEALEAYTRAIEMDPNFADAHFNLAGVLETLNAQNEAQKEWRAYLALDPESPWAEVARQRLRVALKSVEPEQGNEAALEVSDRGGGLQRPEPTVG